MAEITQPTYLSKEALAAKAQELGIDVEQFELPEFPDFINEKGYHLLVTEAKNVKAKKSGASQTEFKLVALDEDESPVKFARSATWLMYPFDTAEYKFPNKEDRENRYRDMTTLLRISGKPEFDEWARKTTDDNKNRYFDHNGNELKGDAFKAAKKTARINVLTELRRREKEDPSAWVGTRFFAVRSVREHEGVVYRNWQRISAQPSNGIEYILNPKKMLTRGSAATTSSHDEDGLF